MREIVKGFPKKNMTKCPKCGSMVRMYLSGNTKEFKCVDLENCGYRRCYIDCSGCEAWGCVCMPDSYPDYITEVEHCSYYQDRVVV